MRFTPRSGRRWLVAAALIAAVGSAGFAAAKAEGFGLRAMHGQADAATAAKHIDRMVERILSDGTPLQKARLKEIASSAFADLAPERAKLREAKQRAHALLSQPTVDRLALEQLRAEQMTRMDAISKRMVAAVADAAEVLTPEQRQRFAEHIKRRGRH